MNVVQATAQLPGYCNEDPCEGEGWTGRSYTLADVHPLFPNCKFSIESLYKTCPDGTVTYTVVRYRFENYLGEITPECAALKAYLALHPEDHQMIYENVVDKSARLTFDYQRSLNPTDPKFKCPVGKTTFYSYVAQCTKYCMYDDMRNITTGGGTGMSYVVPLNCGVSSCCKVKHVICFDEATQSVIDTKTTTRIGPEISCLPVVGNTCPSTFTIQNPINVGGTYDIPLSSTTNCLPSSCPQ